MLDVGVDSRCGLHPQSGLATNWATPSGGKSVVSDWMATNINNFIRVHYLYLSLSCSG